MGLGALDSPLACWQSRSWLQACLPAWCTLAVKHLHIMAPDPPANGIRANVQALVDMSGLLLSVACPRSYLDASACTVEPSVSAAAAAAMLRRSS